MGNISACTRNSSCKISLSSELSSHFHFKMQTEGRIWKTDAKGECRSAIGADAAASGGEAGLDGLSDARTAFHGVEPRSEKNSKSSGRGGM